MASITITKAARQVSEIVGYRIAPSTVRSWCIVDQFNPFWSEDANPPAGSTRRFTGHDLEILTRIAEYRRQNLSYDEIAERLAEPPKAPQPEPAADATQTATAGPDAPIQRAEVGEAAALVTTTVARFDARMNEIDDRLTRIESRTLITVGIAAGFVAGAVLVAIVAALIMMR